MLKKRLFGLTILIVGIMMVFTLAGCGDNGDPTSPPGGGNDDGWPPSSELAKYGLGSWTQPTGLSGITWGTSTVGSLTKTTITFTGATTQTANAIDTYLPTASYPFGSGSPIDTGPTHYHAVFEKTDATYDYAVNYTFDVPSGGTIQLMRTTKGGGTPDPEGSFTITGTKPGTVSSNAAVHARTDSPTLVQLVGSLASSPGTGYFVISNNTVVWAKTPPNATYTIYVEIDDAAMYIRAANVAITSGGGTVDWSDFGSVPLN